MRKILLLAALLAATTLPAKGVTVATGTFFSDHCTNLCGPQANGFATITATDHENGTIDIAIAFLNGNNFANGGQDVVFGFNLVGNPTITYSGLSASFSIPGVIPVNQQNAGVLAADGFGNFEYGIEGTWSGGNGPTSASFSISGAGLTLASFAELSTTPPGDTLAFMVLDILSGTNGRTGFVDLSGGPTPFSVPEVPIPGAVWLFGTGLVGLYLLNRRRKNNDPSPDAGRSQRA
jgi:hypothetical protein